MDLKVFRGVQERYPSRDLLIVTYTPDENLFSDQALEPLKKLREELKKVAIVDTVFTILDAPLFNSSDTDIQEMVNNMPSLEGAGINRIRAQKELINSPIYRDLIVSGDGRTAALLLSLVENKQYDRLLKLRDDLRAKRRQTSLTLEETQSLERITEDYDQVNESLSAERHRDIARIRGIIAPYRQSVSYTHLTLPTICSV